MRMQEAVDEATAIKRDEPLLIMGYNQERRTLPDRPVAVSVEYSTFITEGGVMPCITLMDQAGNPIDGMTHRRAWGYIRRASYVPDGPGDFSLRKER